MPTSKTNHVPGTCFCIAVGHIPESFYPEIAACEPQWEEWKKLGLIGTSDILTALSGAGEPSVVPAVKPENAKSLPSPASSDSDPPPVDVKVPADFPHKGWYSRGYLPHFDCSEVFQFITFHLHDSIPCLTIEQWKQELQWREETDANTKEAAELRRRIEAYLDKGTGACYLRNEQIAGLVQDVLVRLDGSLYHLVAWCIMPNHVHVLIEMKDKPLPRIVWTLKSYTAHEANKLLGRRGKFWMKDHFDRYIRDEKHFNATVKYILENPVRAGLVEIPDQWPWSGWREDHHSPDRKCAKRLPLMEPPLSSRISFLKLHPTLMINTRHLPPEVAERLLQFAQRRSNSDIYLGEDRD